MPGLVTNLLWTFWPHIQAVPRWMKTPVLAYSVLTPLFYSHLNLMTIAFSDGDSCKKKAIEIAKELCSSITRPLTINGDSQAALEAIKSSAIKTRVTFEFKKALIETHGIIECCLVSGHSRIAWHEETCE